MDIMLMALLALLGIVVVLFVVRIFFTKKGDSSLKKVLKFGTGEEDKGANKNVGTTPVWKVGQARDILAQERRSKKLTEEEEKELDWLGSD